MDPSIQMNMFLSSGRTGWPGGVVPGTEQDTRIVALMKASLCAP